MEEALPHADREAFGAPCLGRQLGVDRLDQLLHLHLGPEMRVGVGESELGVRGVRVRVKVEGQASSLAVRLAWIAWVSLSTSASKRYDRGQG